MKSFRTNRLVFSVGAVVIGLILLIWPGTSLMIMGKCVGAVLAAGGLVVAYLYWKDHEAASRALLLVMAVIMLICGIVIFLHPDELVKLIPTIMGILVVFSGLINLGETFLLNRQKYSRWWISLIVAVVTIAAGIFLIYNAFAMASIITRIAGGILILDGASDLWVLSRIAYSEKNKGAEAGAVDVSGTEAPKEETPAGDAAVAASAPDTAASAPTAAASDTGAVANDFSTAAKETNETVAPQREEDIVSRAAETSGPAEPSDPASSEAVTETVKAELVWDSEDIPAETEVPEDHKEASSEETLRIAEDESSNAPGEIK